MTAEQIFDFMSKGGALGVCILVILWLLKERTRLLKELKAWQEKLLAYLEKVKK